MSVRIRGTNGVLASVAGVLGLLALVGGDTPAPGGAGELTALELAAALRASPDSVVVLDVRSEAAFAEFHVPRARLTDFDPVAIVAAAGDAGAHAATVIVVAGDADRDARPGWLALRRAGFDRTHYMPDVLESWLTEIVSPVLASTASARERDAWEEQAELARYFGGFPRILDPSTDTAGGTAERLRRAKRRGCAF